MEEVKNMQDQTAEKDKTADKVAADRDKQKAAREKLIEEIKRRSEEANEAIREGKGRLRLETPILSMDKKIEEVAYDFTKVTGMEYTAAMDADQSAQPGFKITYKQAFALFARAVAKETEGLDTKDVMERMGMMDAAEGVQLAANFFFASIRAARLRISKM